MSKTISRSGPKPGGTETIDVTLNINDPNLEDYLDARRNEWFHDTIKQLHQLTKEQVCHSSQSRRK
jgi:hypothetical protein